MPNIEVCDGCGERFDYQLIHVIGDYFDYELCYGCHRAHLAVEGPRLLTYSGTEYNEQQQRFESNMLHLGNVAEKIKHGRKRLERVW